jgi:hypothetical protein
LTGPAAVGEAAGANVAVGLAAGKALAVGVGMVSSAALKGVGRATGEGVAGPQAPRISARAASTNENFRMGYSF